MALFGKSFGDYVRFQKAFLGIMIAIGILRLGLSLVGAPDILTRIVSLTWFLFLCAVLYPLLVHKRGFGGYTQLLVLIAIITLVSQIVTAAGILAAPLAGVDNAFGAADDPGAIGHAVMHVATFPIMAVILWIVASAILFVTRRLGTKS